MRIVLPLPSEILVPPLTTITNVPLCSNDQFSSEELKLAEDFKKKFRSTAMTIVSFYEVDFTSDKTYLLQVSYVAGIRAIYELAGT